MASPSPSSPLFSSGCFAVLFWNCNGLARRVDELSDFVARHSPDVIALQETRLPNKHRSLFIPNYSIYVTPHIVNNNAGGTALYIKNCIPHNLMPSISIPNFESTIVQINCPNIPQFYLASIYAHQNCFNIDQCVSKIFNHYPNSILVGDFNASHNSWYCSKNNSRGNKLFNLSLNSHVVISTPQQPTYYSRRGNPNIIDFAVFKNFVPAHQIHAFNALSSDHLPIALSLDLSHPCPSPPPKTKTDWRCFYDSLLGVNLPPFALNTPASVDAAVEFVADSIATASAAATSFITNPPPERLPAYILNAIKARNRIRRQWHRTKCPATKILLNSATKKIQRMLYTFRNEIWRSKLSSLSTDNNSLWQFSKNLKSSKTKIPSLSTPSGLVHSDSDKTNTLAAHYENQFRLHPEFSDTSNPFDTNVKNTVNNAISSDPLPNDNAIPPTDLYEVNFLINKLKPRKAPGGDNISNTALKNLPLSFTFFLVTLFNAALKISYFPSAWKHAVIITIPKPGENPAAPSSYRPISLLPCLGKLFEKILHRRLQPLADELDVIPPHQFGFRPKLNTSLQLLRVVEIIADAISTGQSAGLVLFDVSKAFDRVYSTALLYKLICLQFPTSFIKILHSFLSNRSFSVKYNNVFSDVFKINAGVPQGSILSPLLFNIFTSDFPTSPLTHTALYADDTAILAVNKNMPDLVHALQEHIRLIEQWCCRWKVKLNVSKTNAIICTLSRKIPPPLFLHNAPINYSPTVKYLGITIDRRLTWAPHLKLTLQKMHFIKSKLSPLLFSKNVSIFNKRLLYLSTIRPILLYACPVWAAVAPTRLRRIQQFENKTLRSIARVGLYVRNSIIQNDLRITPLASQIKLNSSKFFSKIPNLNNQLLNDLPTYDPSLRKNRRRPRAALAV